jgi:transposase
MIMVANTTYINAAVVCELLQVLADKFPSIPSTLVLDNARYQRCQLVLDKAKQLGIELLFLPSYSPNLNLIERVWKFVKAETLNGKYYDSFAQFQNAINDCLAKLSTKYKSNMNSLITRNFQLFDNQTFLTA